MSVFYRKLAIVIAAAAAIGGIFLFDPIPQDPAYHDFTDKRTFFGLPNFWNVVSNLPFLIAGAFGLMGLPKLAAPELRLHYVVFCVAVMLVAFGSSWYHLAPSNPTLVWDRLPMTVAFMVLFSAIIADRVSWFAGRALLWPLVTAGIASIAWWIRSETAGQGDLRPYALVQFLPMLLVPMILLLWRGNALSTRRLWFAFGAYGAAKLAELLDYHAMKHLLAALAAWWIIRSFQRSPASAL
jgi:ceramidase